MYVIFWKLRLLGTSRFARRRCEMDLQIISDIHQELRDCVFDFEKTANNLAMLGDIGNPFSKSYYDIIEIQSNRYNNVYIIAGNHEYYNPHTVSEVHCRIRSTVAKFDNVFFLDRDTVTRDDVDIHGCTLWSMITDRASTILNDYRQTRFTPDDTRKWHLRDTRWLTQAINKSREQGRKCIVLTHYGPHPVMAGKYYGNSLTSGFVCDLSSLFTDPVIAFASGHVHSNVDTRINGIRCVSNAVGYPGEEDVMYKPMSL